MFDNFDANDNGKLELGDKITAALPVLVMGNVCESVESVGSVCASAMCVGGCVCALHVGGCVCEQTKLIQQTKCIC